MTGAGFSPAETNAIWNSLHTKADLNRLHPRRKVRAALDDINNLDVLIRSYKVTIPKTHHGEIMGYIAKDFPKQYRKAISAMMWLNRKCLKHGMGSVF